MNIFIGTSGWSYPEWKGIVYPNNLPQSKMFQYYQEFFYTTEINSTFYQIPTIKSAQNWAEKSNSMFKFSAKIPDIVTHKSKLNLDECVTPLSDFINSMTPLIASKKLIAFLLQLPPKFGNKGESDYILLKKFASHWEKNIKESLYSRDYQPPNLVVEFRNAYWLNEENIDETFNLLQDYDFSYCSVVEPLLPPILRTTSKSLFYIRFHGYGKKPWFNYNFTNSELEEWAYKLKPILNDVLKEKTEKRKAVLYFNNHFSGYAIKNALYLAKLLNIPVRNKASNLKKPFNILLKSQSSIDDYL